MSKPWVPLQKQLTVEERLKLLLIWRLVKKSDKDDDKQVGVSNGFTKRNR